MISHTYEVAKGNEVDQKFIGQNVNLTRATTVDEALSLGHYPNIEAIVSAAEQQWLIGARQAIRAELGRKPTTGKESEFVAPTLESASVVGNAVKLGAPREHKEQAPKTAKAKVQAASKNAGNKLFEACLADPTKLARLVKMDVVDEAEFEAWKSARDEQKTVSEKFAPEALAHTEAEASKGTPA